MLLIGTLIVLAIWLAFVWFCDPDGFRTRSNQADTNTSDGLTCPRVFGPLNS